MKTNSEFNSGTTIAEGELYEIDGTNIWNHTWHDLKGKIIIKEPDTSQTVQDPVYEIISNGIHIKFAAFKGLIICGVYFISIKDLELPFRKYNIEKSTS